MSTELISEACKGRFASRGKMVRGLSDSFAKGLDSKFEVLADCGGGLSTPQYSVTLCSGRVLFLLKKVISLNIQTLMF